METSCSSTTWTSCARPAAVTFLCVHFVKHAILSWFFFWLRTAKRMWTQPSAICTRIWRTRRHVKRVTTGPTRSRGGKQLRPRMNQFIAWRLLVSWMWKSTAHFLVCTFMPEWEQQWEKHAVLVIVVVQSCFCWGKARKMGLLVGNERIPAEQCNSMRRFLRCRVAGSTCKDISTFGPLVAVRRRVQVVLFSILFGWGQARLWSQRLAVASS